MSQVSLWNILIGFFVVFLAACAGVFLADNMTSHYVYQSSEVLSWEQVIVKSAHSHTNSFGMLHILLGLTLPYSRVSLTVKVLQTIAFGLGTVAMSVLMMIKSQYPAVMGYDGLGALIGLCLSATLIGISSHCYGLALRLRSLN